MLFVSDKAKNRINQIIKDKKVVGDLFIRVEVETGGCSGLSYKLDFDNTVNSNDETFVDKGIKIVTSKRSYLYIINSTIDFSDGLKGRGFFFKNPNAGRTCGCGDSFAV